MDVSFIISSTEDDLDDHAKLGTSDGLLLSSLLKFLLSFNFVSSACDFFSSSFSIFNTFLRFFNGPADDDGEVDMVDSAKSSSAAGSGEEELLSELLSDVDDVDDGSWKEAVRANVDAASAIVANDGDGDRASWSII